MIGLFPVISSRSITPKEKTSDRSVTLPVAAYSGARYLEAEVLTRSQDYSTCIDSFLGNVLRVPTIILPKSSHHARRNNSLFYFLEFCESKICNLQVPGRVYQVDEHTEK
jgi:hypothetical protein